MTKKLCAHGKETWERCQPCEVDILAGKSTGFTPAQPPSNSLLPCPFCGGPSRMATEHDPDGITWHFIRCGECGARSRGNWHSDGNDCPQHRAEVRDEWNRRTAVEPPAERFSKSALPSDDILLDEARDILLKSSIRVEGNEQFILRLMKAHARSSQPPCPGRYHVTLNDQGASHADFLVWDGGIGKRASEKDALELAAVLNATTPYSTATKISEQT